MKNKNIDQIWAVLARNVSIDQQTNVLSLLGVVEEFRMDLPGEAKKALDEKGVLGIPLQEGITLASLFVIKGESDKTESFKIKIAISDPKGKILGEFTNDMHTQGKRRTRAIIQMPQIPVTVSGEYKFTFSVMDGNKWEEGLYVPLEIHLSSENVPIN